MNFYAKEFSELSSVELYEILKSRAEIFVTEQKITCVDMDDVDYVALHCFFYDKNRVVGYLRAYYDEKREVKIGRVLSLSHGRGIGRLLMENAIPEIIKRLPSSLIYVNAQKQAEGFYKNLGFSTVSEIFYEENIPHIRMELKNEEIYNI